MKRRNRIIIGLLAAAAVLFCIIQFLIIPNIQEKQADYDRNQTDALTHDITAIEDYRSAYVGNASNIGGLFEHLPLSDISRKYEIDSDNCILTVYYLDADWSRGREKVRRDLIYNSAAAMAAIDNLQGIVYHFAGETYSFDRQQMEDVFGSPLSDLLTPDTWKDEVQTKLSPEEFCRQFYE